MSEKNLHNKLYFRDMAGLHDISMNRLHPLNMRVFFWAALFIALLCDGGVLLAISYEHYHEPSTWLKVAAILKTVFVIQALGTIFFHSKLAAYQFQRLQAVWLCLVSLKFPLDFYLFTFFITDRSDFPTEEHILGLCFLAGGILLTVVLTKYAFGKVKQGCYRNGHTRLYKFQRAEGTIPKKLSLYFGLAIAGGMLAKSIYKSGNFDLGSNLLLFFSVILHYFVAIGWPEFVLLAYSKFRFKEFILTEENQKKSNWYWFMKPIIVHKSLTGWKLENKAPRRAIWATAGQFTLFYMIFVWLIMLPNHRVDTTLEYIFTLILGIMLMIPTLCLSLILFWLIRVIFKK